MQRWLFGLGLVFVSSTAFAGSDELRLWGNSQRSYEGLVAGQSASATVGGGFLGERVSLFASVTGFEPDAVCHPSQGVCLDLAEPFYLGSHVLTSQGDQRLVFDIPAWVPPGQNVWFQAVILSTAQPIKSVVRHDVVVGPCAPDSLEPNDVAEDATPLVAGERHTQLSSCDSDVDVFETPLAAGERVNVRIRWPAGEDGLMFDALAEHPDVVWHRVRETEQSLHMDGIALVDTQAVWSIRNRKQYLSAERGMVDGVPYDIDVQVDTAPQGPAFCVEDAFESVEPEAEAFPLGHPPIAIDAKLCNAFSDRDDYTFYPHRDTTYEVTLTTPQGSEGYTLTASRWSSGTETVYAGKVDGHTQVLRIPSGALSFPSSLNVHVDAPKVGRGAIDGKPYTLTIQPSDPRRPCVEDSGEDDDTLANATSLGRGGIRQGRTACHDDVDFYTIEVEAGEWLSVKGEPRDGEGRVLLEVYDPSGERLAAVFGNPGGGLVAPVSGTYAVKASLSGVPLDASRFGVWSSHYTGENDDVVYDFTANTVPMHLFECSADVLEPNPETSPTPLPSFGFIPNLTLCGPDDTDWFKVHMVAGQTIDLAYVDQPTQPWLTVHPPYPNGFGGRGPREVYGRSSWRFTAWTTGWHAFEVQPAAVSHAPEPVQDWSFGVRVLP